MSHLLYIPAYAIIRSVYPRALARSAHHRAKMMSGIAPLFPRSSRVHLRLDAARIIRFFLKEEKCSTFVCTSGRCSSYSR